MEDIDKWDCAPNEAACTEAGCCWVPVTSDRDTPWCFYPDNVPNPCLGDVYNWNADSPGFSDEEYNTMYANYESNLNIR